DDRIVVQREAADGPHADLRAGADLTGRGQHDDTRRSSANQLADITGRGERRHRVGIDGLDDVADGAAFDRAAGAGHDDLVELHGARGEGKVRGNRLASADGDDLLARGVAQGAGANVRVAGGNTAERKSSLCVGAGAGERASIGTHRRDVNV